jgi:hypothetical protein
MPRSFTRRSALATLALTAFAGQALAHHGWSWTDGERYELTGTIVEIYLGQPHATLKVEAADGVWDVDLAPLSRTLAAGFDENAAKVGDEITAIGNRSSDPDDRHMKAVRLIVNGKTYDVYPDRVNTI